MTFIQGIYIYIPETAQDFRVYYYYYYYYYYYCYYYYYYYYY